MAEYYQSFGNLRKISDLKSTQSTLVLLCNIANNKMHINIQLHADRKKIVFKDESDIVISIHKEKGVSIESYLSFFVN